MYIIPNHGQTFDDHLKYEGLYFDFLFLYVCRDIPEHMAGSRIHLLL
jgi:hypothetical protein